MNGKIGAVGSSYVHYKGTPYQRKVAITRALDELSLQQGVKVEVNMQKIEHITNNKAKVDLKVDASYNASATISAHIEDVWRDPSSKEIFIWMVLN